MVMWTFKTFPALTTKRLSLRRLLVSDEQQIFTLRSDRDVNRYLDRQLCNTIDDARTFIGKIIENDSLYWAITLSENDILIGAICLFNLSEKNSKCEIGFELLPSFQGKGIMMEALAKVIDYAFNTLKVEELEAVLHKENSSSKRLLEKVSFIKSNDPDKLHSSLECYQLRSSGDDR